MVTITILASDNCHPCCWYAKERRCHCSCHGQNHGRLNPARPQGIAHAATIKGRTYQATLFNLEARLNPFQRVLDQDPRTCPDLRPPSIASCRQCSIPMVQPMIQPIIQPMIQPAGAPPNLCGSCRSLRTTHRRFVKARLERITALRQPGLTCTQPEIPQNQQPGTPENNHAPTAMTYPWFLLP